MLIEFHAKVIAMVGLRLGIRVGCFVMCILKYYTEKKFPIQLFIVKSDARGYFCPVENNTLCGRQLIFNAI